MRNMLAMSMKRNLGRFVAMILIFSSMAGIVPRASTAPGQTLVEGNTGFALNLYGQIKTRPGNLFFSPYSISTVLAMTYAGARGDTEKQMARVLHFDKDQRQLHSAFGQLQRQLNQADNQKGIQLNIVNALW